MSLGIIGKKVGMTRVFNDKGESVPVTVINVEPNIVSQVKTVDTDDITRAFARQYRFNSRNKTTYIACPDNGCTIFMFHLSCYMLI